MRTDALVRAVWALPTCETTVRTYSGSRPGAIFPPVMRRTTASLLNLGGRETDPSRLDTRHGGQS